MTIFPKLWSSRIDFSKDSTRPPARKSPHEVVHHALETISAQIQSETLFLLKP